MTNEELEFWKVVYAASIINSDTSLAKIKADTAVQHLREVNEDRK